MEKKKKKKNGFDCIDRAEDSTPFTDVIQLPPDTETFACSLWGLGRYDSHYSTWTFRTPSEIPYWCQT